MGPDGHKRLEPNDANAWMVLRSRCHVSARTGWAWAAAIAVIASVVLLCWRFRVEGYLPQPMYFRPAETFTDLYTPAQWANGGGAYTIWHSLYPPLSFA